MGIVLGQGLTPLLVTSKEDVPLMNIVWFIPAGFGSILTMWKVQLTLSFQKVFLNFSSTKLRKLLTEIVIFQAHFQMSPIFLLRGVKKLKSPQQY